MRLLPVRDGEGDREAGEEHDRRQSVGDSVATLRLYPDAHYEARNRVESFPGDSYWLVTRRAAYLGECGGARFVTVPPPSLRR